MCLPQTVNEQKKDDYVTYDEAIRFHGHSCAGLASGYR
jgi:formylmethanofuran dehydrogenase subunit E